MPTRSHRIRLDGGLKTAARPEAENSTKIALSRQTFKSPMDSGLALDGIIRMITRNPPDLARPALGPVTSGPGPPGAGNNDGSWYVSQAFLQ